MPKMFSFLLYLGIQCPEGVLSTSQEENNFMGTGLLGGLVDEFGGWEEDDPPADDPRFTFSDILNYSIFGRRREN